MFQRKIVIFTSHMRLLLILFFYYRSIITCCVNGYNNFIIYIYIFCVPKLIKVKKFNTQIQVFVSARRQKVKRQKDKRTKGREVKKISQGVKLQNWDYRDACEGKQFTVAVSLL